MKMDDMNSKDIYIHKLTGNRLKIVKKRDDYSTYLMVDDPFKQFWNRLMENTVICKNENVIAIDKNNQGSLF